MIEVLDSFTQQIFPGKRFCYDNNDIRDSGCKISMELTGSGDFRFQGKVVLSITNTFRLPLTFFLPRRQQTPHTHQC